MCDRLDVRPVHCSDRHVVTASGEVYALAIERITVDGRVYHFPRQRLKAYWLAQDRNWCVHINQSRILSIIVASAWIRPLSRNERVIHIDGDRDNNAVSNLRIVSAREAFATRYTGRNRISREMQKRGEIWRPVPGTSTLEISNYKRLKSTAMLPHIIRTPQSVKGLDVITFRRTDGRRSTRTVEAIYREVFPDDAGGKKRRQKAPKKR